AKGGIAKFLFNKGIKAGEKFYGNGYNKPNIFVRIWKYPIYTKGCGRKRCWKEGKCKIRLNTDFLLRY
ncbi:MAG: hypothetical protein IIT73_08400, partial [Treponema sp.]|nr:hypothetical protein [Treponema sp.]